MNKIDGIYEEMTKIKHSSFEHRDVHVMCPGHSLLVLIGIFEACRYPGHVKISDKFELRPDQTIHFFCKDL